MTAAEALPDDTDMLKAMLLAERAEITSAQPSAIGLAQPRCTYSCTWISLITLRMTAQRSRRVSFLRVDGIRPAISPSPQQCSVTP
jgi:hypothetical protein